VYGHAKRLGGAVGNAHLTSLVGAVLIVPLAVEGATIPFLGSLLSVHIFVGMLLLGPVALKLASTGYRFARYYRQSDEYVRAGPPVPFMRFVVAPVVVLTTITLFTSGVLLIATPQRGAVLLLHKASFVVWLGATAVHVLAHLVELGRALRRRLPGVGLRFVLLGVSVLAGAVLAMGTLPAADRLQDHATRFAGFDRH
jgi:hypothetical protein